MNSHGSPEEEEERRVEGKGGRRGSANSAGEVEERRSAVDGRRRRIEIGNATASANLGEQRARGQESDCGCAVENEWGLGFRRAGGRADYSRWAAGLPLGHRATCVYRTVPRDRVAAQARPGASGPCRLGHAGHRARPGPCRAKTPGHGPGRRAAVCMANFAHVACRIG
jgi:hypothetical protein